jgi:hypothetical protein
MNDDRLETEIRSMLAGRDPGAAPARLHFALRQIPTTLGRSSPLINVPRRLMPLAAAFGTLAILAAVVVAIGLVGIGRVAPSPVGPGGSPAPQSSWVPFDPTADGSGIASAPNDVPISFVLVACGVLAVVATVRTKSRRRRAAASVVIGLTMVAVFSLRSTPLVGWDGGGGAAGVGYIGSTGGLVADADIFAVGPYGVLTYGFDLTNTGPLPIDLIGLAPDPVGGAWAVGMGPSQTSVGAGSIRVTAAGLLRDPNVYSLLPADTRPWERVHLPPGERQFLVLAVRAGPCALGRDNRGDEYRSDDVLERVGVVYDVVGIQTMATVTLPRPIAIPRQVNDCPAA